MYLAPTHSSGGHIPDPAAEKDLRAWADDGRADYELMVAEEERAEQVIAAMAGHDDGRDTYDPLEARDRQMRREAENPYKLHATRLPFEGAASL
jgi:predicted dienelactone hydrolase